MVSFVILPGELWGSDCPIFAFRIGSIPHPVMGATRDYGR